MRVVNCKNENDAHELLSKLRRDGFRWIDGNKITKATYWNSYKEYTCYVINENQEVALSYVSKCAHLGYKVEIYEGESK